MKKPEQLFCCGIVVIARVAKVTIYMKPCTYHALTGLCGSFIGFSLIIVVLTTKPQYKPGDPSQTLRPPARRSRIFVLIRIFFSLRTRPPKANMITLSARARLWARLWSSAALVLRVTGGAACET